MSLAHIDTFTAICTGFCLSDRRLLQFPDPDGRVFGARSQIAYTRIGLVIEHAQANDQICVTFQELTIPCVQIVNLKKLRQIIELID